MWSSTYVLDLALVAIGFVALLAVDSIDERLSRRRDHTSNGEDPAAFPTGAAGSRFDGTGGTSQSRGLP